MPIIASLLDNDFYNFTMGQVIWRHYRGVQVTYQLTNRTTGVELGRLVNLGELQTEIAAARRLRFAPAELAYLRSLGTFDPRYLDWLAGLRLPAVDVKVAAGGQLDVSYRGEWAEAVFWETPLLAIVNELANRARSRGQERQVIAEAKRRLEAKLTQLAARPYIRFMEFGTRRRFSRQHQDYVVQRLVQTIPAQVTGTSNVALARKYRLTPSGTMAHQLFMVTTALGRAAGHDHPIAWSQRTVLDQFEQEFAHVDGGRLLVFLPDTYGTETGLRLLEPERAARWAGMRQDSGDPVAEVERMLAYYREHGIDPRLHRIIPSDGLDVALMDQLARRFGRQTQIGFGLGTHLTNDTPVAPVSIVIKPVRANGAACGKLSSNLAKATGTPGVIAALRAEAEYHSSYSLVPTV